MLDIAIVNDTEIAIEALRRAISTRPDYRLLWVARTGSEAIKSCAIRRPDLILMDMNMPDLDGVEATRQIMQQSPCAILIVTASIIGNTSKVFEAMGHGALDVVKTPSTGDYRGLFRKIATVAKLIRPSSSRVCISPPTASLTFHKIHLPPLIAIGASTGGPSALYQILSRFPRDFKAAIVIIQHIDEQFAPGLVNWLDRERRNLRQGDNMTRSPQLDRRFGHPKNNATLVTFGNGLPAERSQQCHARRSIPSHTREENGQTRSPPMASRTLQKDIYRRSIGSLHGFSGIA